MRQREGGNSQGWLQIGSGFGIENGVFRIGLAQWAIMIFQSGHHGAVTATAPSRTEGRRDAARPGGHGPGLGPRRVGGGLVVAVAEPAPSVLAPQPASRDRAVDRIRGLWADGTGRMAFIKN
jgi:hypothetical protein